MKIDKNTIKQFSKYSDEQIERSSINLCIWGICVLLVLSFISFPLALIISGLLFYYSIKFRLLLKERKDSDFGPVNNNIIKNNRNIIKNEKTDIKIEENKKIISNIEKNETVKSNVISNDKTEKEQEPIPEVDESTKNYNLFKDITDESLLCYSYEKNICLSEGAINSVTGNGGEKLRFIQEPDNEYDPNAVALYLKDEKIGYMYKGDTQKMVNDWIKKGFFFWGYINKISVAENKATYKIGFYKPLDIIDSKTYSLLKTTKKIDEFESRADNIMFVDVGHVVSVDYDYEIDRYVVSTKYGSEIGELSESATTYINENTRRENIGIISDYSYDDRPKAKVTIYFI